MDKADIEVEAVVVVKPNRRARASFWAEELKASEKMLEQWHKQANRIVKRYTDARSHATWESMDTANNGQFRLNLFHANINTQQAMLYSSLPTIDVARRNADPNDDIARVAGEMMERLLNLDVEVNGSDYDSVFSGVLQDRLLPGLGVARVRYTYDTTTRDIPTPTGVVQEEIPTNEKAPVEYYHWQDVLYGWARDFSTVPWIAFRSYLTKDQATERFGPEVAEQLEYKVQKAGEVDDGDEMPEDSTPWQMCMVWEIWDKETRTVYWYTPGLSQLLEQQQDPLQLKGFYPCPPFLLANPTTALYKPTPDYHMTQDLYNEVDRLQTRIAIITEAVKVTGVYDSGASGVQRMLNEGVENELIPIDSWAMFAEAGGLRGAVDWLPLQDIVGTLDKLRAVRDETIGLLQQITGMSDIMQGGLRNQYEGVGQSQIKAQFGAVRIQALQDQFARFVSDLMQLKAEIICRHFEPQSIIEQSNMRFGYDAERMPQAVQLLKQPEMANLRVTIRPETVALVDYARLKTERTEFVNAMATFLQSAAPLVQADKTTTPYLLQMLQWGLAGFKGSAEIEGVLDQAIEQAQKNAQRPDKDDDKDAKRDQAKLQGELQKINAKLQADMQLRQMDLQADMQTTQAAAQSRMAEISANLQANLSEIQHKMVADAQKEQAATQANIAQTEAAAQTEIQKDAINAQLDMEKDAEKAANEIEKIATASALKLEEMRQASKQRPTGGENDA